jgi:nicotinamidase-related amidase
MLIDLNYPAPVAVELPAEQTLLLVIDMENENAHPDGALFIGEPVRKIIPKIARLREEMRRAGGRIVHTQSVRSPDEKEVLQAFSLFKSFGYKHNVTMTRSDLIRFSETKESIS